METAPLQDFLHLVFIRVERYNFAFNSNERMMKKSNFYWLCALLMLALTGCSDDDGLGASAETLDGRWLLVKADYGYGGFKKYEVGQTVLKINLADKTMTVSHSKEGADDTFLKSGVYSFTTTTEQSRIYTYKWVDEEHQIIKIKTTDEFGDHEHKYMYSIKDGMLFFDGGVAYDGDGYLFSRY